LGRTLWWALGELTRCAAVPAVAWAPADAAALSPTWLDDARQAGGRAEQLWHIPEQGQEYPWWGFKVGERYTLKLRDDIIGLLDKAKKQLDKLMQAAEQYASQIGVKGSV